MKQESEILIHTALYHEALPIINSLNLRQFETRPYKIFRGGGIVLVVSGVGRENTRNALGTILKDGNFTRAINIGMAGCGDTGVPVGSLFRAHGRPDGLPEKPLITVESPQSRESPTPAGPGEAPQTAEPAPAAPTPASGWPVQPMPPAHPGTEETHFSPGNDTVTGAPLLDMEAAAFLEIVAPLIPPDGVHVLKVVSDHLDDRIPAAGTIHQLMEASLSGWSYLVDGYADKIDRVIAETAFDNLSREDRSAIVRAAVQWRFSHQEIRQIIEMAIDFTMWCRPPVAGLLEQPAASRKKALEGVRGQWQKIKDTPKSYRDFQGTTDRKAFESRTATSLQGRSPGFGRCPVASSRTRCCNLLTLDAVEGCGFDCSYCSIRYFYREDAIGFDENLSETLKNLEIDPALRYHIGTGQSSDSLMWGNRAGILDALLDFAGKHSNVILELKTKSDNVAHLLKTGIPDNVITSWSLNPQAVIEAEEHYTASLERRLDAALQVAGAGGLVGFHFHPMVHYENWKEEYGAIFTRLLAAFRPEDVAMVSLGTLTFIKPVIRNFRRRAVKSRILQMPLEQAEGKLSYPRDTKRNLFRFAWESLSDWHDKVFFYMCMEDASLWNEVFGYEYRDNDEFENAMIAHYEEKILEKRHSHR